MFSELPKPKQKMGPFAISVAFNVLLLLLFCLGAMTKQVIDAPRYEQTQLVMPEKQEPPKEKPNEPKPLPVKPPKAEAEQKQPDLPEEIKPLPRPVQKVAKVEQQTAPLLPPPPPRQVPSFGPKYSETPNQVAQARPSAQFGPNYTYTPNTGAKTQQSAQFGPNYGNTSNVNAKKQQAGQFGPSYSNGQPGGVGKPRPGGQFGPNYNNNSQATTGTARQGGQFGPTYESAPQSVSAQRLPVATTTPVIGSTPTPQYTAEALRLRVQGNVELRVKLLATGKVVVEEVVHGLGHGLDEEARRVAEQIKFKPAMRNGQPVDFSTTITVKFKLA